MKLRITSKGICIKKFTKKKKQKNTYTHEIITNYKGERNFENKLKCKHAEKKKKNKTCANSRCINISINNCDVGDAMMP
jgi:hypothetical protein